jgi:hypothetical protein
MDNAGEVAHQLMVVRLHDGVTLADYAAGFGTDEVAAEDLIDHAGGVNATDAGATGHGYADLSEPGRYALLCFLPGPGGESHLHLGMSAEIEVVPTESPVPPPATDGEVTLIDYNVILPEGFGTGTYEFVNEGAEPHEVVVMRIDDDKTLDDVIAYLQGGFVGEAPLSFRGGAGGVEPGRVGYVDLDLPAGQYVAMCFISGKETHMPHAAMGMVVPFEVA